MVGLRSLNLGNCGICSDPEDYKGLPYLVRESDVAWIAPSVVSLYVTAGEVLEK